MLSKMCTAYMVENEEKTLNFLNCNPSEGSFDMYQTVSGWSASLNIGIYRNHDISRKPSTSRKNVSDKHCLV